MNLLVSNEPTLINASLGLVRCATYAVPVVGDLLKIYATFHDGVKKTYSTETDIFDLSQLRDDRELYTKTTTVRYDSSEFEIEEAVIGHDRDVTLFAVAKIVSALVIAILYSLNTATISIGVCSALLACYAIKVDLDCINEYLGKLTGEVQESLYLFTSSLVYPATIETGPRR